MTRWRIAFAIRRAANHGIAGNPWRFAAYAQKLDCFHNFKDASVDAEDRARLLLERILVEDRHVKVKGQLIPSAQQWSAIH